MFSHKQRVQCCKSHKNVGPVIACNHILIVVNRWENAAPQDVGLHEAPLAEQKLITAAASVDLIMYKN